jgi:hypothetical protein
MLHVALPQPTRRSWQLGTDCPLLLAPQITVDGDTSTNDTVIGLCSGASGLPTITSASSPEGQLLQSALTALLQVGAAGSLGCLGRSPGGCMDVAGARQLMVELAPRAQCASITCWQQLQRRRRRRLQLLYLRIWSPAAASQCLEHHWKRRPVVPSSCAARCSSLPSINSQLLSSHLTPNT